MQRKVLFSVGAILFFVIASFFIYEKASDEDGWVCVNNEWQRHGNPDAPKPNTGCEMPKCEALALADCSGGCVVCPPCEVCSSLSCQTKEFCESIGFDEDWYDSIKSAINDFESCVKAGNAIMESYPRQCAAGEKVYVEKINEEKNSDLIILEKPQEGEKITSPLTIEGRARGNWFFEATFPVYLADSNGVIIAEGSATAKSDWMTGDYVPFSAMLDFETQKNGKSGSLILKKSNPSGLPDNDQAFNIKVVF